MLKPYINLFRCLIIAILQTLHLTYKLTRIIIKWLYRFLRVVLPILGTVICYIVSFVFNLAAGLFRLAWRILNIVGWFVAVFMGIHILREIFKR